MKWLYPALVLLAVAAPAAPAAWRARHPPIPNLLAHKDGCYIKEIEDVIPFGAEVTPTGSCQRIACEKRYLDYADCGKVEATLPCHVTAPSLTLAYPDCCPYVKCEENNLVI